MEGTWVEAVKQQMQRAANKGEASERGAPPQCSWRGQGPDREGNASFQEAGVPGTFAASRCSQHWFAADAAPCTMVCSTNSRANQGLRVCQ